MKKIITGFIVVLFLGLAGVLVVRLVNVLAGKVATISSEELKQQLDSKKAPILLDVREVEELTDDLDHLPGIIHIPIGTLSNRISEMEEHKGKEIVTICRAGVRASKAAKILMKAGFKQVKVLEGGMMAYRKAEGH
jgi:rhodanese-related sulfurtransferase